MATYRAVALHQILHVWLRVAFEPFSEIRARGVRGRHSSFPPAGTPGGVARRRDPPRLVRREPLHRHAAGG